MRTLFAALAVCLPAVAADTPVTPDPTWAGSVADEGLQKDAPEVITDAKAFAKLWEKWKVGDKVPEVDFTKKLVAVVTSRGGSLRMTATRTEAGDLRVGGFGTRDLRPGFRYVIGVFDRDGVKTVNGKALPKG